MTTDTHQTERTRVLTGITTTGTPHLGNYVGAIRPTVRASLNPATQGFYFLADYHALIKCDEPARTNCMNRLLACCPRPTSAAKNPG